MSDWRDVLAETFNRHRDEWHRQERETISVGEAVMSLPPAARIAMARELLEGTGMVVVPQPMSLAECFEEYHRRAAIMDEAIMREAQDPTP